MKLVVFDMDGTLIDSQHDITVSINHVRAERYALPPLSADFVVASINARERNLAKLFYGTERYESQARELFEAHYHEQCVQTPRLYDGIENLLGELKARGYALCVATNAPSKFAARMIAHLGVAQMFDHIVGADMVSTPKPAPDMLHYIFERSGFDPKVHQGWMVGDNSKDMEAARAAGLGALFAAWGFADDGEGDHVCDTPQNVLHLL